MELARIRIINILKKLRINVFIKEFTFCAILLERSDRIKRENSVSWMS